MIYRNGRIVTDGTQRASSDQSVRGLKKMLRDDEESALALADRIVKNTYRTLMTRGMKGCFVYCTDAALAEYLRTRLKLESAPGVSAVVSADPTWSPEQISNVVPFARVRADQRAAGAPAVPLVDLRFAAGDVLRLPSVA